MSAVPARDSAVPASYAELVIGVLLPDVLGTYSDAGNALILAQRARWRGVRTRVLDITATTAPPASCDIYLLRGGEDGAQAFAAEWLTRYPALRHAMSTTAVTLAVCAGLQILGQSMSDRSGHIYSGLGLLDFTTIAGRRRAVGEVLSACTIPGVGQLTGFENHQGISTTGDDLSPLGWVTRGVGNGTADRSGHRGDGACTGRIIGTYLHGPVLARNPALADHILKQATGQPMPPLDLPDQRAVRRTYLPTPDTPPAAERRRRGPDLQCRRQSAQRPCRCGCSWARSAGPDPPSNHRPGPRTTGDADSG
jgi:lipid II isoglutaminyl synthase (glutamine-hydrolysing)